jgi:Zn-dependent protease with chaperone function
MKMPFRKAADGPLLGLVALVAAMSAGLAYFMLRRSLPVDPFQSCLTLVETVQVRLTALGVLSPAAFIAVMLLSALLAAGHQAWATRQMLNRVLAARVPLDPSLARLAEEIGLAGRMDLVSDPSVYTFCHGLLAPRVCLSTGLRALLDDDELRAVLMHEAHHLGHRDPLKILLGRSLASALFFLPLAGALRNAFLAGKELSADAAATVFGGELALASALFKMLRAERPVWPAGVLAIGALSPTEARLRQLLEPEPIRPNWPSAKDWISSAMLIAAIFGFAFGSAAKAQAAPLDAACRPPLLHSGLDAVPEFLPITQPESASRVLSHANGDELLVPTHRPAILDCDRVCEPGEPLAR